MEVEGIIKTLKSKDISELRVYARNMNIEERKMMGEEIITTITNILYSTILNLKFRYTMEALRLFIKHFGYVDIDDERIIETVITCLYGIKF